VLGFPCFFLQLVLKIYAGDREGTLLLPVLEKFESDLCLALAQRLHYPDEFEQLLL